MAIEHHEGAKSKAAPEGDAAHPLAFHNVVGSDGLPKGYKGPPVDLPGVMFKDYVHAVHRSDPTHRWDREQSFEKRLTALKESDPKSYEAANNIGKMIKAGKSPDEIGKAIGGFLKDSWENAKGPHDLQELTKIANGLMLSAEGGFKGSPEQIQKQMQALLNGTEAGINPDPEHPGKALPPGSDPNNFYSAVIKGPDGQMMAYIPHAALLDEKGFPREPGSAPGPKDEPAIKLDLAKVTETPK